MGTLITKHARKTGTNALSGAVARGADGNLTLDLARVFNTLAQSGNFGVDNDREIALMRQSLGDNPTLDALTSYSNTRETTTGGDADMATTSTWSPIAGATGGKEALDSAREAFGITEKGQQDAARIQQEGRDRAAVANMGAGIASAQRQNLNAAEGAAFDGGEGGVADVIQGSNIEEEGGEEGGNDTARRRRQAYGGAGLALRI